MAPSKPSNKNKKTKGKQAARKSGRKKGSGAKKPGLFARLFRFGLLAAIWGVIGLIFVLSWYYVTLPDMADVKLVTANAGVDIYDRDDWRIARSGQRRGEIIAVEDLPHHLKNAVIAIEDRRFYDHGGIDMLGISRAMLANLKAGGFVQGGSTLTQQLAKNLFLEPDKNIGRKIQEAMLALWLERKLTKDEILTAYLNRVYFGSGAYGITAAVHRYYNKPASALSLAESAQLAASLKAPSRINPVANPEASAMRARIVMQVMESQNMISQQDIESAIRQLEDGVKRRSHAVSDDVPHYYTDWVLDQAGNYTNQASDGLAIYTDFDHDLYKLGLTHVNRFFETAAESANVGQIAVVLMEYDGTLRMMMGGKSYSHSQFNRAVQAKRQPGSAFKPVVYLSALEKGYRPGTRVQDGLFEEDDAYRPANYADEYYGEVTFTEALARSLNTATVRLADEIGISTILQTARELGISSPVKRDLSSALGSSEVSLLEMTTVYASFANGGQAVYPHSITRLEDRNGQMIYQSREFTRRPQLFSRRAVADLQYMLNSAVENGTGRAAYLADARHIGGKTGTSQDHRDAWFIGYADGYVLGIWMGNDDNSPMNGVTGGSHPARLWRAIMNDVLREKPLNTRQPAPRRSPPGMFERVLDQWSGRTAGGQ